MPRVIVDVMLKPEILDPQGKAVKAALARLGYAGIGDARQGKRFELTLDHDPTAADLDAIGQAARTLLSNPVIEDVVAIRVEDAALAAPGLVAPVLVAPVSASADLGEIARSGSVSASAGAGVSVRAGAVPVADLPGEELPSTPAGLGR